LRAFESDPSYNKFLFSNIFAGKFFSTIFIEEEQFPKALKPYGDLLQ
jgi:hypothetical protein